jgi:hypothetical protein
MKIQVNQVISFEIDQELHNEKKNGQKSLVQICPALSLSQAAY